MSLLEGRDIWGDEFNRRFLARFVHLLSDPDEAVRDEALDFVGCNSGWAEARQVPFGRDVVDPVIKATKSPSAKERFEAVFALAYVRKLAPEVSREAFLRLVDDPDENVRWRLGFCLAGQYKREDVKLAIAGLVKDKSPLVRSGVGTGQDGIPAFSQRDPVDPMPDRADGPASHLPRLGIPQLAR